MIAFADSRSYRGRLVPQEDLSDRGVLGRAAYSLGIVVRGVYEVFRGPRDSAERIRLTGESKLNSACRREVMAEASL